MDGFVNAPRSPAAAARLALVAGIAVYGFLCARSPETWRFLDGVDLLIHEAGHVVFAPFGEFVGFLGGTLLQLLMPIAFTVYFLRQDQRFAAMVTLFWVAQNLFNISVYARDARAQALPLVGGEDVVHDWFYLLGRLDLLAYDQQIGGMIRAIGVCVYLYAVVQAYHYASWPVRRRTPADR